MSPELADRAVHQFEPGVDAYGEPISKFNPDMADVVAGDIERKFGTVERVPGWRNADVFARGGAEYAKNNASLHGGVDEAYTASRHLMSPERFDYMQKYGRTVDLLRGLRAGDPETAPQVAVKYYRNSWQEPLAKGGWGEAKYQRESDDTMTRPMASFLQDPTSPVAWYLRTSNLIPVMIRSTADGASTAAANAAGYKDYYDRFKDVGGLGEVLDVSPEADPESYSRRAEQVRSLGLDIEPPGWQNVVGGASPAVADAVGYAGEALDASMGASLVASPMRIVGRSLLSRKPVSPTGIASALGRQAVEEGAGEAPMMAAGAATQAMAPSERTWAQYFFGPGVPEERDPEATRRAASVLSGLKRYSPNDIWSARSRHRPSASGNGSSQGAEASFGEFY